MIYTVGHEASYDAALGVAAGGGEPVTKLGPFWSADDGSRYAGGIAFLSTDDALAYLDAVGRRGVWAVYELRASPADMAAAAEGETFQRLTCDCLIVGKVAR